MDCVYGKSGFEKGYNYMECGYDMDSGGMWMIFGAVG